VISNVCRRRGTWQASNSNNNNNKLCRFIFVITVVSDSLTVESRSELWMMLELTYHLPSDLLFNQIRDGKLDKNWRI